MLWRRVIRIPATEYFQTTRILHIVYSLLYLLDQKTSCTLVILGNVLISFLFLAAQMK